GGHGLRRVRAATRLVRVPDDCVRLTGVLLGTGRRENLGARRHCRAAVAGEGWVSEARCRVTRLDQIKARAMVVAHYRHVSSTVEVLVREDVPALLAVVEAAKQAHHVWGNTYAEGY